MSTTVAPKRWRLQSGRIDDVVEAADQFEAWDSLRQRPASDFGIIASADDGSGNPVMVHTAQLMFRWYRDADARLAVKAAVRAGLPDTTAADLKAAGR